MSIAIQIFSFPSLTKILFLGSIVFNSKKMSKMRPQFIKGGIFIN